MAESLEDISTDWDIDRKRENDGRADLRHLAEMMLLCVWRQETTISCPWLRRRLYMIEIAIENSRSRLGVIDSPASIYPNDGFRS